MPGVGGEMVRGHAHWCRATPTGAEPRPFWGQGGGIWGLNTNGAWSKATPTQDRSHAPLVHAHAHFGEGHAHFGVWAGPP